jgi:hypothetical protein
MCVVNLGMDDNQKLAHLSNSILFNSVLLGKEIRFSDMIKYFMEYFNFNPFINQGFHGYVLRENNHTDIWVNINYHQTVLPNTLIENKLVSLPNEIQLQNYALRFIKRFISEYKSYLRENLGVNRITENILNQHWNEISELINECNFILLSPTGGENIPCHTIIINHRIDVEWQHLSYSDLGGNIGRYNNAQENLDAYIRCYWKDFAEILMSFSILNIHQPDINESISQAFNPTPLFENLNLKPLYSKTMAFYCTLHLRDALGNINPPPEVNNNWNHQIINIGDIIIKYDYTNGEGLFEVLKRVGENTVYLLQYQSNELRKGLIIHQENEALCHPWISDNWHNLDFAIYNNNMYRFAISNGFYYFHSKYTVNEEDSIGDIVQLMAEHINDTTPLVC